MRGLALAITMGMLFAMYPLGFWYGSMQVENGNMSAGQVWTVFINVVVCNMVLSVMRQESVIYLFWFPNTRFLVGKDAIIASLPPQTTNSRVRKYGRGYCNFGRALSFIRKHACCVCYRATRATFVPSQRDPSDAYLVCSLGHLDWAKQRQVSPRSPKV